MTDLLQIEETFPDVTLESIRKIYIYLRKRANEYVAIRKALHRLLDGETGKKMTPEEAVTFLRSRVAECRASFAGRERKFTPHLTTLLNQRRYLNVEALPPPENLEDAITILACYPTITAVNVDAHMPILRVLDEHIRYLEATHGKAAASYIRTRTLRYAECVRKWPEQELQFVPNPLKWFKERRYEQSDKFWERTPANGYQSERNQLASLI